MTVEADIAAINTKLDAMTTLWENELKHLAKSDQDMEDWRDGFMAESGPWRGMDRRVEKVERLAVGVRWLAASLSPVAVWAVIEIVEAMASRLK